MKEFINKEQPSLTLHGHIHEGPQTGSWKDTIGKTICVNPGRGNMLNMIIIDLNTLNVKYKVI